MDCLCFFFFFNLLFLIHSFIPSQWVLEAVGEVHEQTNDDGGCNEQHQNDNGQRVQTRLVNARRHRSCFFF